MESLIVGTLAASVVLVSGCWKGTSPLRQILGCILIFGRCILISVFSEAPVEAYSYNDTFFPINSPEDLGSGSLSVKEKLAVSSWSEISKGSKS